MPQAARYYGYTPNRAGYIKCPFHGEKTASLKIKERSFRCYGCGKSGTVIDFVSFLYGIPFVSACVRLNADFGLGLSTDRPDPEEATRLRRMRREAEERDRAKEAAQLEREESWWQVFSIYDYLREAKKAGHEHEDYAVTCLWLERLSYWLDVNYYWWQDECPNKRGDTQSNIHIA